ncbi:glycosyltransferase family 4 protein [Acidimicrobiia bacterium]|nr:glycosyltransferase family 4 protein [Acidimicrobiia bacterium]
MHIILVFTYGISLKNWEESGILTREIELYKKLHYEKNAKITFITFGNKQDEKFSKLIDDLEIIPIYKDIKKSNFSLVNLIKSLYAAFKIQINKDDATFIKTNQLNGSWVALALKLKYRLPLYVRTGYNLFEFSIREKKSIIVKIFNYLLTQIMLFASDEYSVSSQSDKDYLNKNFLMSKNIIIIPNWVSDNVFRKFDDRYENRVLAVGRLENQKNFKTLIEVLSKSEIFLDIVGTGSQRIELEELANTVDTRLNLLGNLDYSDLNKLYSKYRLFILPSFFEGNPKVVLEAMSRGTLVVAKENKNLEEVIKTSENGILFEDSSKLLKIIKYYLSHEDEWSNLTTNAYTTIKENNLLDKITEDEVNIYLRIIENRKA